MAIGEPRYACALELFVLILILIYFKIHLNMKPSTT